MDDSQWSWTLVVPVAGRVIANIAARAQRDDVLALAEAIDWDHLRQITISR